MCGIFGIADQRNSDLATFCQQLTFELKHRGPDDDGVWNDAKSGLAFGFRRLAILDLTQDGHQPMLSHSGRFVIVFNGEIYNHPALRTELQQHGYIFKSRSDTEVILQAFEAWGIEAAVKKFTGMFACAVWDKRDEELSLIRDRIGEKPLYYGWLGSTFFFTSELSTVRKSGKIDLEIDRDALSLMMQYSYIPAPHSIFKGLYKLIPGTILTLGLKDLHSKPVNFSAFCDQAKFSPQPYWSLRSHVENRAILTLPEEDNLNKLQELLRDAISGQMIADVPIGAFLSGGIDSSTVVALMQNINPGKVRTYSIGFDEKDFNEANYAKQIAQHLGTIHTEMYVTSGQALDLIPQLPDTYSEPFADPSQIPTTLLSRLTRQHITVALSGDGADELFCGYSRYQAAEQMWGYLRLFPQPLKPILKAFAATLPDQILNFAYKLIRPSTRFSDASSRIRRLISQVNARDGRSFYQGLLRYWQPHEKIVLQSEAARTLLGDSLNDLSNINLKEWMMFADAITYLPDDILAKVDRASMSASLETRAPFLDHRVIEFIWSLPLKQRINSGTSKWLLRKLLYRHVPKNLVDRPKMGFGVPIAQWLRGPLRHWAEELISEERLRKQGYLDVKLVRDKWFQHQNGRANHEFALWNVLMFQQWLN